MPEETFKAKMGLAVYVFCLGFELFIIAVICVFLYVYLIIPEFSASMFMLVLLLFGGLALIPLLMLRWALNSIKIFLKEDSLFVKGMLGVEHDVPYSSITSVREVADISEYYYSYTASSKYSLEIRYGKDGKVNISPADREGFLSKLVPRLSDPSICVRGGGKDGRGEKTVSLGLTAFGSEEARSLGKLTRYLTAASLAVLFAIVIILVYNYDELIAARLYIYPGMVCPLIMMVFLSRQARKVQQDMDNHDLYAARAKLKRGRIIGACLFVLSVVISILMAALIVRY